MIDGRASAGAALDVLPSVRKTQPGCYIELDKDGVNLGECGEYLCGIVRSHGGHAVDTGRSGSPVVEPI